MKEGRLGNVAAMVQGARSKILDATLLHMPLYMYTCTRTRHVAIDWKHGPLIWALTCFFLVWVGFKVWALILEWYILGM